jgi:protein pelota
MKFLQKDYKRSYVKLKIENLDDLWFLNYIIEKSDMLKALTYRKIKLGGELEDKKIIKKPAFLGIEVEKVEFSKYSSNLRISGLVREGPEDIPFGSHHTISLEEGTEFSLEKKKFLKYQIDKLEESAKENKSKILVVVYDREEAYFAMLKKYGYELLGSIKGQVQKKVDKKTEVADFFQEIKKTIEEYDTRYNFSNIVLASPNFWREYMQKIMKEKIIFATCSSVGVNGINEVIKRQEVQEVLKQERFAEEIKKVDMLLEEISKQGKAEYGMIEVSKVIDSGAVEYLLVTDSLIQKYRQEEKFEKLDYMMKNTESMNGKVIIISSENDGGQKLDGLGGIGAILRYKLR